MTIRASNQDPEGDLYMILRHLFGAAQVMASMDDKPQWSFYGSFTDIGNDIVTEYKNNFTSDRIKAQSFSFVDVKPTKHIFTFTKGQEGIES